MFRSDLLTYASSIEIPGAPGRETSDDSDKIVPLRKDFGAHHILWIECLQKVEDGKIPRLMGLFPPGSGKSIYSSVVFPTHVMGRFPKFSMIMASYGTDLPIKFGRRARSIVKQPIYQQSFETRLSDESAAADQWALTNGSEWMGAGIMTGITGNRADGVVWDDLIKGREQDDSPVVRQKTWDAYMDDLLTRKKPKAWEVAVTTRWHEDDVAGRILPLNYNGESGWIKCRDGNDWYVVCLPAECEREDDLLGRKIGDILWPEWFSKEFFAPFKRNWRTWTSLYQQRPSPETGEYFKSEWLRSYEFDPKTGMPTYRDETGKLVVKKREEFTIYGASDYAVTSEGGDYTVHVIVGIDQDYNIYLLDLWRKQASSDVWVEAFCDLVLKWKPAGWAEEKGQINAAMGPLIVKRMRERQAFTVRAGYPARGKKEVRAQPFRGRIATQGFYVPAGASWLPDLKSEMMSFPNGRTDDQVDALGLIGQSLDKIIPGSGPPKEPEKPKVFSTDPKECTVTLDDLWEANDRKRNSNKILRIG